ncbi:hypothetical protein F4821DRAFT_238165 [Hypoxylon rubiginosum]|uniref:Uncharacterized protein n=1 Tax=Hypoxylon rubiginosum TaxID=110542 RepID=A0ACC0D1N9_9PEZI|nr:hypothetical protein F4821DRAFT_238165 [Hypoxylon rubiginosum]
MMATNNTAKAIGEHRQAEEIPAFQSIAPCIFVPAQTDLTKPPSDLPSEPNALLSETLGQINEHADAVQDNIYYMLDREKTRIRQECRQREAHLPHHLKVTPGLEEGEDQWLVDSTTGVEEVLFVRSIVHKPERGPYEVPPSFTHSQCLHAEFSGKETPRKYAEKMVLNLAKHGVQNLEGLAQYVNNVKEAKSKELENEKLSKSPGSVGIAPADADKMDTS